MQLQFAPRGFLALDPRAFGALFQVEQASATDTFNGAAVVRVRGPLMSRRHDCFDSYEAILERVDLALQRKPSAVVLDLHSPGGQAQGCFEAVLALRERCSSADVPLIAYVAGEACSAAYALACAAGTIGVTSTAVVGSIGVYDTLASQADAEAAAGLAYRVVTTGERKRDGNPHVAISDGAVAAVQAAVDSLGELFFGLVEQARSIPSSDIRALDGAVLIGRDAVTKRLADIEVSNLSQLLKTVLAAPQLTVPRGKTMDEIRKGLQAIIDDPNATDEDKAKAKAMLATLDGTTEAKADSAAASKDEDVDDAVALATRALAESHALRAELAKRDEAAERAGLLASRPDFAPELVATLRKAPTAMVREMVATLPRSTPASLAAASQVQPTLGKGQVSAPSQLSAEAKAKLDAQMGLTRHTYGVLDAGSEQLFGVPVKNA